MAPIPLLSQIPVIGPIFFEQKPLTYIMLLLVVGIYWMLFYTRWGLRARAVGEHPRAADTLGVNVLRTRYINTLVGGADRAGWAAPGSPWRPWTSSAPA